MNPELLNTIGQAMMRAVPDRWERLVLEVTGAGNIVRTKLRAELADGTVNTRVALDRTSTKACRQLRDESYQESKGTWYNAVLVIGEEDKITADFDYENPPFGGLADDPSTQGGHANVELLMKDQEMFPRDPELLPEWHPARQAAQS